jgi:hypothetical protein
MTIPLTFTDAEEESAIGDIYLQNIGANKTYYLPMLNLSVSGEVFCLLILYSGVKVFF